MTTPTTSSHHSTSQPHRLLVYTDGACSPNPGVGGWAVLFLTDCGDVFIGGGERASTNNIMELTAAIRALECIDSDIPVDLHSDSTYVVKGVNEWLAGWQRRQWKDVANTALWQRLAALLPGRDVRFFHVRAHREHGNEHERRNCQCDHLAVRFRKFISTQ